ncbi:MAG: hypothetical protein KatS3mg010_0435 [Acidimicrobiia bacterium]|nr:MAG: hypothetical protein KatS3mg010_0435 [Acidimicrobiia bacterium]
MSGVRPRSRYPRPFRLADAAARERGCDRVGHQDLAALGGMLCSGGSARYGSGHDELVVRTAGAEEVHRSAVHADRHAQRDPADRGRDARGLAERGAHLDGGAAPLCGRLVALEHEQQRVAAELEQAAAPLVGELEHRAEDAVEYLCQFLGTDAPSAGKSFRQVGEAGDVDEDERRVDNVPIGAVGLPGRRDARDESAGIDPHRTGIEFAHAPSSDARRRTG